MAAVTPEPQEHTVGRAGSTPADWKMAASSPAGRSRPSETTCNMREGLASFSLLCGAAVHFANLLDHDNDGTDAWYASKHMILCR